MSTWMQQEIHHTPDALERARVQNDGALARIAQRIKEKDTVFFAARGTSGHAAMYGKYVFETQLGMPAGLISPSVCSVLERRVDYSRSVVVGISQSGEAEDVRRVLKSTRKSGAYTVAITNNAASALAASSRFTRAQPPP